MLSETNLYERRHMSMDTIRKGNDILERYLKYKFHEKSPPENFHEAFDL
jgi:hypothetical protein